MTKFLGMWVEISRQREKILKGGAESHSKVSGADVAWGVKKGESCLFKIIFSLFLRFLSNSKIECGAPKGLMYIVVFI